MIVDKAIPAIKKKKFFEDCYAHAKTRRSDFKELTQKHEPIDLERKGRRLLPSTKVWPTEPGYYVSLEGSGTHSGKYPNDELSLEEFTKIKLKDGDRVYPKRGEVWNYGGYVNTKNNVIFESVGVGDDNKWQGADDIATLSWTNEGSNVYSTDYAIEPNWVWINGQCAKLAETGRITVQGRASTTQITVTHGHVSGYTTIVGSYLVMKVNQFRNSHRVKVTNYSSGTITIDDDIPTANNIDFVLYNKIEYFNALGNNQWCWEAGKLYIKTTVAPAGMDIRASAFNFGISTTGSMTIRNLELTQYYNYAIHSDGGVINVNNTYIHDCRDIAIYVERQVTGLHIDDDVFERIGNTCILTRPCISSTYNRNVGNDIGMQINYGWQTFSGGPASSIAPGGTQVNGAFLAYVIDLEDDALDGYDCEANYNSLNNIAYNGLAFNLGTHGMKMMYNTCLQFTRRFSDGGGIYTFHYRAYNVLQTGTEIAHNICINDDNLGYGVYIDNRTVQANVHDNVVAGCLWGYNFNTDTEEHTVTDNISVNCPYNYVFRTGSNGTNFISQNEGNTFTGNLAVAYTGQKCLFFDINTGSEPTWNPFTGGSSDNNQYVATTTVIADSENEGTNLTLATLRTAYGQDAASASRVESSRIFEYNTTNAPVNDNAGAGYETFEGVETDAFTIPAHYAVVLFPIPVGPYYENSLQLVAASSQYTNHGTNADIQFTQTDVWTIEGWFKVPSNPASTIVLWDNRDGSGRGLAIQMLTTGAIQTQMVNTVSTNRIIYVGSVDYADGNWHFLQISKTGSGVLSLVHKVDESTLTMNTASNNLTATILSTADILFGRNAAGTVYADVELAGWAYYPSNQNANSASHYNGGVTHDLMLLATPPTHYWKFDGDLLDYGSSANDLNGTAFGSPIFTTDVP